MGVALTWAIVDMAATLPYGRATDKVTVRLGVAYRVLKHQPGDQHRRFLLHRRDGVRVGVEGDRDSGLAEAFGDGFGQGLNDRYDAA